MHYDHHPFLSGDRKASVLEKILDYSAQNMNPLRVLYNLEVGFIIRSMKLNFQWLIQM